MPMQRKRSSAGEDLGGGVAKRSKTDGVWDLRFMIPSQRAGAVIGKSGKHIVELRSKFNCKLVVPDCEGVPERLLLVRVSKQLLPELLQTLVGKLAGAGSSSGDGPFSDNGGGNNEDNGNSGNNNSMRSEMKLLLHQKEAVALIGKGGSRIKEIRENTHASIKIFDKTCPLSSDKIVRISGTVAVVTSAVSSVCEYLENEDVQINDHYTYDPANYDPYTAYEWGGMDPNDENFALSSNPKGRGPRGGPGVPGGPGGPGGRDWPPPHGPPMGGGHHTAWGGGPEPRGGTGGRYNDYDYDYDYPPPPPRGNGPYADHRVNPRGHSRAASGAGGPRSGPGGHHGGQPPHNRISNGRPPRRNY